MPGDRSVRVWWTFSRFCGGLPCRSFGVMNYDAVHVARGQMVGGLQLQGLGGVGAHGLVVVLSSR
jgi:hypothetical protein